jgi:hypothetical protein
MLLSLVRPRTRLPTARTVAADSLLHCASSRTPTRTAPDDPFHDPSGRDAGACRQRHPRAQARRRSRSLSATKQSFGVGSIGAPARFRVRPRGIVAAICGGRMLCRGSERPSRRPLTSRSAPRASVLVSSTRRSETTERAIHLSQVPPCFLGFGAKGGGPQARRRRDRVLMGASLVGRSRLGWRSGCGR